MRKFLAALVLAAGTVLGLAACGGSSGPTTGTVIAKHYTPGHSEKYMEPVIIGKSVMEFPETRYISPEWRLELENCVTSKGTYCQTGWVDVPESSYNHYTIGEVYP